MVPKPPEMKTRLLPGLGVVAAAVGLAFLVNRAVPALSVLMTALILGLLVTNLGFPHLPAYAFAGRWLLRGGVVLLGLQLSIPQVLALGPAMIAVVAASVLVTFAGTRWLGRRLGLSPERSLLVAAGFSICGASAVAAMNGVADGDEEDVLSAVTLVTIFGSLAVLVLPLLRHPLGLSPTNFGLWAGASVHEVGQVVAVSGTAGADALAAAVVVKLTRVALLAPVIAVAGMSHRTGSGRRPPAVPVFVLGFLAAMCVRSMGVLPPQVLKGATQAQTTLLAAGMFGMGASVRLRSLVRAGGRGLTLGLASTLLIATISYAGIALT